MRMSTQANGPTDDAAVQTASYTPGETRFIVAPKAADVDQALATEQWVSAKKDSLVEVRQ